MAFGNHFRGNGLKAQLLRGGGGSLGLKLSNKILTLCVTILLARVLGPEGYGIYAFSLAGFMLLGVPAKSGLPLLLMRETAAAGVQKDYATIGALWRWSTLFLLVSAGLVLSLGIIAVWAAHGWMDNRRLLTFAVGLPLILVTGLSALRGAALRGLHRVVLAQVPEMTVRPLLMLVGVGISLMLMPANWLQPYWAMAITVFATGGSFVVGAMLLRRHRPPNIRPSTPSRETRKEWRAAILPLAFLAGAQVINKNTDIFMLGLLGNDAQVGIYRVAMQGGLLVIFATQALNKVLMPYLSSANARRDSDKLQRLVAAGTWATTAASFCVAAVFWLFGTTILQLVFGPEYVAAYVPLSILAAGQVFGASLGQVGALLNMTGYETQSLRGFLISLFVNIVLNATLIPFFGMVGAATATSLSLVVLNLTLWQSVRMRLGINSSVFGLLWARRTRKVA